MKEIAKPFLRWAGGKNWLVKHITNSLRSLEFETYHEPFLGGGAIFFSLDHKQSNLSDINEELINSFVQVRDNVNDIIDVLETFQNTEEFYYKIRAKKYKNPVDAAARFIYLNQTSFNGIYRVNLKGEYNVPYGHRKKDFVQKNLLREASKKLEKSSISCKKFYSILDEINENDLVFLDPPYTITHNNNGFIKYNEKLFKEEDQILLSSFIEDIKAKGAKYILTNAAHSKIKEIFYHDDPIELSRSSSVGGRKARRGQYKEYLFTNIPSELLIG